ncbi:MAG: class I SAM-dependent methyltransferase [Pirellulaceae bacterium]|nr:class I SAM-dependent methyltransferase [Pirellulaceae bacterium]MDP7019683.1 class I SAM-dependent methyltransferase [Pirellulaceae bacterium]
MNRSPLTAADIDWLQTPAAQKLFAAFAEHGDIPRAVVALRKRHPGERVRLVAAQVELRHRAREKFTAANQMFFSATLLEQATDEWIASHKAHRFGGADRVVDLCCGLGGDLTALARATVACRGIDRSDEAVSLAAANTQVAGVDVEVRCAEASECDLEGALLHIDPDRRATGQRATRVESFSPPASLIAQWIERAAAGGVKIAPASEPPTEWTDGRTEREWIGGRGECRQQMLWFGDIVQTSGRRRATVVASDGSAESIVESDRAVDAVAPRLLDYLYEPHAAVLAAHLSGALAERLGLAAVAPGACYFTSDRFVTTPLAACFRIVESAPFDRKRWRSLLRARGVGRLEIKKRGVDIAPDELRKSLRLKGDSAATLIVVRRGEQVVGVLAERM